MSQAAAAVVLTLGVAGVVAAVVGGAWLDPRRWTVRRLLRELEVSSGMPAGPERECREASVDAQVRAMLEPRRSRRDEVVAALAPLVVAGLAAGVAGWAMAVLLR